MASCYGLFGVADDDTDVASSSLNRITNLDSNQTIKQPSISSPPNPSTLSTLSLIAPPRPSPTDTPSKIATCCICGLNEKKYKCPGCERSTCSLQCCKAHKVKFECEGKRDLTKFQKLSEYDQSTFLSDYFFLEDVNRIIDANKRDRRKLETTVSVSRKNRPQSGPGSSNHRRKWQKGRRRRSKFSGPNNNNRTTKPGPNHDHPKASSQPNADS